MLEVSKFVLHQDIKLTGKSLTGRRGSTEFFESVMTAEEQSLLQKLDRILRFEQVRAQILPIVERVRADLARKQDALMAWEPIPLTLFSGALPAVIRSSWVFILRARANTGAERHPNSHQRMMSFKGIGDMQTEAEPAGGAAHARSDIVWQSNILVSDPEASLERRWISIPQNVWHRAVIPKGAGWAVISFHTVPAEELIEERPRSSGGGRKQMRYLASDRKG
jgi:hypothetical protein